MQTVTARRHHFVPQAYLKGFSAQPRVQVFDLVARKAFLTSAENIAVERDFNRVDLPGVPIDDLEQRFARIEGDVIGAIRKIHVARTLDVVADLHLVLNLVGLLLCRNPRARQSRNNSFARLVKRIAKASVASRERYERTLGHPRHDARIQCLTRT